MIYVCDIKDGMFIPVRQTDVAALRRFIDENDGGQVSVELIGTFDAEKCGPPVNNPCKCGCNCRK